MTEVDHPATVAARREPPGWRDRLTGAAIASLVAGGAMTAFAFVDELARHDPALPYLGWSMSLTFFVATAVAGGIVCTYGILVSIIIDRNLGHRLPYAIAAYLVSGLAGGAVVGLLLSPDFGGVTWLAALGGLCAVSGAVTAARRPRGRITTAMTILVLGGLAVLAVSLVFAAVQRTGH